MPTRYRAEPFKPHSRWGAIRDSMYSALEPKAVSILEPTGFYDRHDLETPTVSEGRELVGEERAAIEAIATALTIAADCAHKTPPGVVAAWLRKLANKPALFRTCRPKYIGRSYQTTEGSLSDRERTSKTCCGAGAGFYSKPRRAARRTSTLAGLQDWPRKSYGSRAVVREITVIGYWLNILGGSSIPLAGASFAARSRWIKWEEGYDTLKMVRSIASSRR